MINKLCKLKKKGKTNKEKTLDKELHKNMSVIDFHGTLAIETKNVRNSRIILILSKFLNNFAGNRHFCFILVADVVFIFLF